MACTASIGESVPVGPSLQPAFTARSGGSRSFPPGITPKRCFLKRFMETQANYYSDATSFSAVNTTDVFDDQSRTSSEAHGAVGNSSGHFNTADPLGQDVHAILMDSPARSSTDSGFADTEKLTAATGNLLNPKRKRRKLISKICLPPKESLGVYRTPADLLDILMDRVPQQPCPDEHECALCSPPKGIENGRVFSCHWQNCPAKPFKKRHHLLDHLNSHNGNKPQRCKFCGRHFTHSGTKSRHERTCASNPAGQRSCRKKSKSQGQGTGADRETAHKCRSHCDTLSPL